MSVATFTQNAVNTTRSRGRLGKPKLFGSVLGRPRAGLAPPPSPSPFRLPGFGALTPTGKSVNALKQAGMNIPPPTVGRPVGQPVTGLPGAIPVAPVAPVPPDPRDAEYWAALGQLGFDRTSQLADLERAQGYDDQDLKDNVARLADQRIQSLSNAKKSANKDGLFYSSVLTNRNRDVEKGYADQEGAMEEAHRRQAAEREAARDAIYRALGRGGDDYGSKGTSLLADAISRQMERDLLAPPPAEPTKAPKPAAPKATSSKPQASSKKPKDDGKRGKVVGTQKTGITGAVKSGRNRKRKGRK